MESFRKAAEYYSYVINEKSDPRVGTWPLMGSPVPILAIIGAYYYFIKVIGPQFMATRKPYDLKKIMIIYNTSQCIISILSTWQALVIMHNPEYSISCAPVVYSTDPFHMKMAKVTYIYLLIKLLDLSDTIFMVLRKNYRQVTFLHVYHHIGMSLGTWIIAKYMPGAHLCVVGFINSFVHAIMYFYYLLSAYDNETKKSIWWKKHMTELQMVQFVLVFLHHMFAFINPKCEYPKLALLIFMSQNFVIVYLFSKFYYKTYIKKNKEKI